MTSPFLQAPPECGLTTGLAAALLVHTPMCRSRLPFPTLLLCFLILLLRLPPKHRASLLTPQLPNRLPSHMFPSFLIPLLRLLPNRKLSRQAPRLSCRHRLMQMPQAAPGVLIQGFSSIKYRMGSLQCTCSCGNIIIKEMLINRSGSMFSIDYVIYSGASCTLLITATVGVKLTVNALKQLASVAASLASAYRPRHRSCLATRKFRLLHTNVGNLATLPSSRTCTEAQGRSK